MNVQGKAPAILTLALLLLLPCARPQAQPARQQAAPPLAVAAGQPDPSRTLRLRNRRLRQAEEQLRGLRQRQAETLSKMLELAEQDAERLAILFALAALYQEGAELAEQAAGTFADEQTQGAASGEQLRPEQSMVRLRQEAVACRSEALAALDRVRRLSSEPAVVAEAASQRAALLIGQGQQDEAREQYREALAAAPSSPQGRDAALHLGNEALGSGRLEEAQQLFQQVLDHGGVTTDDLPSLFASWGIGSCHFRRKQLPQATATFSSLLLILQRTRPGSTLFEKVRSSYLRALAEGSSFDEAWTQLVQLLGEQTASAQLPDLAESYQSLPRYEDALLAWKMLLGRAAEPARQLHCRWRILQDLAALGRDEEALGELPEALERSKAMLLSASLPPEAPAIGEPAPVQLAGPDLQLLAETRDLAEKVAASLLLARVAQVESPGGLAEPAVRSLAGMLQSHAEIFPGSARRRSLQLGQGTALYLLGSLIEAARHFDEVFAAEGDSELGRQAGLKAVLALGQALQQLPAEGRGEAEAMARRILAISDRWLAGARPANEGAALVSLDRARALRLLGQDEQALAELEPLVAGKGDHAAQAAEQALDIWYQRKSWTELAALTARYLADGELGAGEGDFHERVGKIRCEAAYRSAWKQTPDGHLPTGDPELAPRLESFAQQLASCTEAPVALLAAGRLFQESGRLSEARRVFEQLLALPPALAVAERGQGGRRRQGGRGQEGERGEVAGPVEQLMRLGATCEGLADFFCAVAAYERALPLQPDCPAKSNLARRLYLLLEAQEEHERGWSMVQQTLAACPGETELARLPFSAGVAAMNEGRPSQAERAFALFRALRRAPPDEELAIRLYGEAMAFGRGKVDDLELERLVLEQQSMDGSGEAAGRAAAHAATALVLAAGLRLRTLCQRLTRQGTARDLEELARLSRLLDGWARNIASWGLAGIEPALGVRALVQAGEGLQQAAAALVAAGGTELVGEGDEKLAPWLHGLGQRLIDETQRMEPTPTPWLLRARLQSTSPLARQWRTLLPHMLPHLLQPAGAAFPLAGIPWMADLLPGATLEQR